MPTIHHSSGSPEPAVTARDDGRRTGGPRVARADQRQATDEIASGDLWLFHEGTHSRLHHVLGGHLLPGGGARFAVWAPNAERVSVIGDANGWDPGAHPLGPGAARGCGSGWRPRRRPASATSSTSSRGSGGYRVDKADPFAVFAEQPPRTASVLHDLAYEWGDGDWMATRGERNNHHAPMSIYELHIGSWRHVDGRAPVAELPRAGRAPRRSRPRHRLHPRRAAAGHGASRSTARGATRPPATSRRRRRFGTPAGLHVPDRPPAPARASASCSTGSRRTSRPTSTAWRYFDGTHLYEHADPRKGFHPDWNSLHLQLRPPRGAVVPAVERLLVARALPRRRRCGSTPSPRCSTSTTRARPASGSPTSTAATRTSARCASSSSSTRRSTASSPTSRRSPRSPPPGRWCRGPPTSVGSGFGFKWDMGWMHDTLEYLERRSRAPAATTTTASRSAPLYAFTENYVLPLSHDEVVHGKGSLLAKMPGDQWQRFANLRMLYGYQFGQSGKKLLFMGDEIGQDSEWNHDMPLSWDLLDDPLHAGVQRWVAHLNAAAPRPSRPCTSSTATPTGSSGSTPRTRAASVISFLRLPRTAGGEPDAELPPTFPGAGRRRPVLVVANFTPVPREHYAIGVPVGWSLGGAGQQRCRRVRRQRLGELRRGRRRRRSPCTVVPGQCPWCCRRWACSCSPRPDASMAKLAAGCPRSGTVERYARPVP